MNFESQLFQYLENLKNNLRTQPMFLGGTASWSGGIGGPPGGFIGYLPQTRVAYDFGELATSGTPVSGMSLWDNLNHIRYRIQVLENGGVNPSGTSTTLIVEEDGTVVASGVTIINFVGANVTETGEGEITVSISSSGVSSSGINVESFIDISTLHFSGATVTNPSPNEVLISIDIPTASGGGDMYKSVYDTNNDGIVDQAASVPWSGITNVPSVFTPDAHTHDDRYYTKTELQTSGQASVHWGNITNVPDLTSSGITDAPIDGNIYGRQNGDWEIVSVSASGYITNPMTTLGDMLYQPDIIVLENSDSSGNKVIAAVGTTKTIIPAGALQIAGSSGNITIFVNVFTSQNHDGNYKTTTVALCRDSINGEVLWSSTQNMGADTTSGHDRQFTTIYIDSAVTTGKYCLSVVSSSPAAIYSDTRVFTITGTTSNPTRLPIGEEGQVLTVNSGIPAWITLSGIAASGIDEAPIDGGLYGRQDGEWVIISGIANTSITVKDNDTTLSGITTLEFNGATVSTKSLNSTTAIIVISGGSGSGDMLKSEYDTDNDGIVDTAEKIYGVDTAGNLKYYGTNSAGTVGFYTVPSGGSSSGATDILMIQVFS